MDKNDGEGKSVAACMPRPYLRSVLALIRCFARSHIIGRTARDLTEILILTSVEVAEILFRMHRSPRYDI